MNFTIEPGTYAKDINDLWKVFAFKLLEKMEKDLECSLDFKVVPAFPHSKSAVYKIAVRHMSKYCLTQNHVFSVDSDMQKSQSVYANLVMALTIDRDAQMWSFVFPHFYGFCHCHFSSKNLESCIIEIDIGKCEWKLHRDAFAYVDTKEKRRIYGIEDI